MMLFLTFVLSKYNEVMFKYNNQIIDSIGFVFEYDAKNFVPEFEIGCIDIQTFSPAFKKSLVSSFERFNCKNYYIFVVDLSEFDYDRFKTRYFVFRGFCSNLMLSTPIMKHKENDVHDIEMRGIERNNPFTRNKRVERPFMSLNDKNNRILNFFEIGFNEEFCKDCIGRNGCFLGERSLDVSLMGGYHWTTGRRIISDILGKNLPYLLRRESSSLYNDRKISVQNQLKEERNELFRRVLTRQETDFRSDMLKTLEENSDQDPFFSYGTRSHLRHSAETYLLFYKKNDGNN